MPRKRTDAHPAGARAALGPRFRRPDSAGATRTNAEIAGEILELRTSAGLSQRALAELVGTTASVICRLEDANYEGHSLAMLKRIAAALNRRVEVRFVRANVPRQSDERPP